MVGALFRVDHDNKRSFRRYRNKVGMGHGVTLTARRVNFVGGEGNGAIEFANGVKDHGGFNPAQPVSNFSQGFASSWAPVFR